MDVEKRKEIFFLKINDTLFKPHIDPVGKIIVSELHQLDGNKKRFTDIEIIDNQKYFIMAAPSTWPPFIANMDKLVVFLAKLGAQGFKTILIYHAEAHADDSWPIGYGIFQPKTLDQRINNCKTLLEKFP